MSRLSFTTVVHCSAYFGCIYVLVSEIFPSKVLLASKYLGSNVHSVVFMFLLFMKSKCVGWKISAVMDFIVELPCRKTSGRNKRSVCNYINCCIAPNTKSKISWKSLPAPDIPKVNMQRDYDILYIHSKSVLLPEFPVHTYGLKLEWETGCMMFLSQFCNSLKIKAFGAFGRLEGSWNTALIEWAWFLFSVDSI